MKYLSVLLVLGLLSCQGISHAFGLLDPLYDSGTGAITLKEPTCSSGDGRVAYIKTTKAASPVDTSRNTVSIGENDKCGFMYDCVPT